MRLPSIFLLLSSAAYAANPPTPTGQHPRLFLPTRLTALTTNATKTGSAAELLVRACQDTIDNPTDYMGRGGSDGDYWPASAVSCAFSWVTTQNPTHLQQALTYWRASLDDDQTIGDHMGCVANAANNWQSWDGNPPAPAIIRTVTHDTGYPMRWYGPYIALTYDWLHDAPGVDGGLLSQTRTCLTAWVDYYTQNGYHHDEPGANYNAGFVIGKTMTAIALGTDAGADGDRLWNETLNDVFGTLLTGQGLTDPSGVMVGGDWAEGWQYGPLSVLEYAAAAVAVEEWNAPQPAMDSWASSLAVRYVYGTLPALDAQYVGNGDFDDTAVYAPPSLNTLDAVLLGPSSDQAAAWAAFYKTTQMPGRQGRVWNALAEVRQVTPADYRAQSPAPSLWYLARGTRALYARTDWTANAFWAVFQSEPQVVSDHQHFAAGNLVFSRGSDALIVDPSQYGYPETLATNAVTVDSPGVGGDYAPSQTPWSKAELVWARGTTSGTFAARSDFAQAFIFSDNPSDIPYAHREWVLFPEGEMVTVDRAHTADAAHKMYVSFHANTGGGGLALTASLASGTVGGSQVTIHAALLSGGTPSVSQPAIGDCGGNYPFGPCTNARFAVDDYQVQVPGPFAVAVHVVDGGPVGVSATVGSMNDDTVDPLPKQNAGVLGAAVLRSGKQSYVVASSAVDGASPATMTYGVPGTASRHVVFDAPEDSSGKSNVTAAASGGRCVITITAGSAMAGRPLMFSVTDAASGCTVTADTDAGPGTAPTGGGVPGGGGGTHIPQPSGCGCEVGGASPSLSLLWLAVMALCAVFIRNIRRARPAPASNAASSRASGSSVPTPTGNRL